MFCGYEREKADSGSSDEAGAAGQTPLPLSKRFGGYFVTVFCSLENYITLTSEPVQSICIKRPIFEGKLCYPLFPTKEVLITDGKNVLAVLFPSIPPVQYKDVLVLPPGDVASAQRVGSCLQPKGGLV